MSAKITSDTGPCAIVPLWLIQADVSDRALRVWALIAAKWADRDDHAFPSRQTIGEAIPLPKRARAMLRRPRRPNLRGSVDRALAELEEVGAISVRRHPKLPGKPWEVNVYVLHRVHPDRRVSAAMGSRVSAPTGSRVSATGGSRVSAPRTRGDVEPDPVRTRGTRAGARDPFVMKPPTVRDEVREQREQLKTAKAVWLEVRTMRRLVRFTDAKAMANLRTSVHRALDEGIEWRDIEAAVRAHATEPQANPWYADEWSREASADRREREHQAAKMRDREDEQRGREHPRPGALHPIGETVARAVAGVSS